MFSRIPDANFCPKVVCMAVSAGSLRQADLLSGGLLPGLDFRLTIPSPDTTHDGGGIEPGGPLDRGEELSAYGFSSQAWRLLCQDTDSCRTGERRTQLVL